MVVDPALMASPAAVAVCWAARSHREGRWTGSDRRALSVCVFEVFKGWQTVDGLAGLFLRQAQVVKALQIEPEFGAGAEEMRQAQSGVAGDGAPAV